MKLHVTSLLIVGSLLLTSCNDSYPPIIETAKTKELRMNVANGNPLCFGRFVINTPKDVQLIVSDIPNNNIAAGMYEFEGLKMFIEKYPGPSFENALQEKIKTLKSSEHERFESLFKRHEKISHSDQFIYSWPTEFSYEAFEMEIAAVRNEILFRFEALIEPEKERLADELARQIASKLSSRERWQVPTEPGFCFDLGFIKDDGSVYRAETGDIGFTLSSHPDVLIEIMFYPASSKEEPNLLEREKTGLAGLPVNFQKEFEKIRTLRRGELNTEHLTGLISADAMPLAGGDFYHLFWWEHQGAPENNFDPVIIVQMKTGFNPNRHDLAPSSLTDDEALTLFESIVNSIRLRLPPNNKTNVSSTVPKQPTFTTGDKAPKAGFYSHSEINTITPTSIYLNAGDRLPPVMRKRSRSLSEWLRGYPRVQAEETKWVYDVAHNHPPKNENV